MSKFFNVVSNKKNQNNNNYINTNNSNGNGRIQGYVTPQDYNNTNNANNSSNNTVPDTFVYGSYNNNRMNNNMNNNMNNIQNNISNNNSSYMNGNEQRMVTPPVREVETPKVMKPSLDSSNTEILEETEVLETSSLKEAKTENLDPLNNANNPIPVNPVAEPEETFIEEELPKDVKANIFSVIGMMLGMILTPGTTIVNNSKKYRSTYKAIMITLWITAVSLALSVAARILLGSFSKSYSVVTGSSHINFNLNNIFSLDNYLQYMIIAVLISFVGIMIISLVYYASSFLNSKGVPLGSYIMVSNLAMLPLIIGVVAVAPAISIISSYLSILALVFCFLYTLIAFLTGINEILTFKNINRKILYNVLNLSCIILISIVLYVILLRMNVLVLPDLNLNI